MKCNHCISPANRGDVTTVRPCESCGAHVCAEHRNLHYNLIHLTADEAQHTAVRLAWGDLMGVDDPEHPGYPFAAVTYRKGLPEWMQDGVEEVIVYVYHKEQTPAHLKPDAGHVA